MRTIERHGRESVRLLFTDTSMEDEDLYRFLDESGCRWLAKPFRLAELLRVVRDVVG